MKFWTIMIITYGAGKFDGERSTILYPDIMTCGEAIDTMYEDLHQAFPDLMIQCKETDKSSVPLVRPKPRPEGLSKD